MLKEINIRTKDEFEIIDITNDVERLIDIEEGIAIVFTKHTTTALIINEYEKGLLEDIKETLYRLIPRRGSYKHDIIDTNAHSHLKACLLNTCLVIPIMNKRLSLGTWQRILFVELDGPRERKVYVKQIKG